MTDYPIFEHDVIVIGVSGADFRIAITWQRFRVSVCFATFIFIFALFLAEGAIGQKHSRPVDPKTNVSSKTWQDVMWGKWGLKFSLPPGWTMVDGTTRDNNGVENGFHEEVKTYSGEPPRKGNVQTRDFSIVVTSWPGKTANIQGPTRLLRLEPSELMDAEQGTPTRWRLSRELEEIGYLEIGGIKGVFKQLNLNLKPVSSDQTISIFWTMYRVYEGNIQRVELSVEGKRTKREVLKRILTSFTFAELRKPVSKRITNSL